jgi:hypothetical protein
MEVTSNSLIFNSKSACAALTDMGVEEESVASGGVGDCDLPPNCDILLFSEDCGRRFCCRASLSRWLMAATDADRFDLGTASLLSAMFATDVTMGLF